MTTQPLGHSCQSIPEHRSHTSSPGMATQPLGPLWLAEYPRTPLGPLWLAEYPRTPELHRQSRDCPGMTTQPLCQGIPEHWSYTSSPVIVLGRLPSPRDLSGRVSQNAGVTPAVPGLSQDDYTQPLSQSIPEHRSYTSCPGIVRDDYPTPGPLCQSIPERRSYSGSPGIVPG